MVEIIILMTYELFMLESDVQWKYYDQQQTFYSALDIIN